MGCCHMVTGIVTIWETPVQYCHPYWSPYGPPYGKQSIWETVWGRYGRQYGLNMAVNMVINMAVPIWLTILLPILHTIWSYKMGCCHMVTGVVTIWEIIWECQEEGVLGYNMACFCHMVDLQYGSRYCYPNC